MSDVRVIHFRAENVKRLQVVEFDPDRNVVVVAGRNDQGKSSVLDAVLYALGGKKALPIEPVRRGTETATIKLDLGDFIIERKMRAKGGDSLTIKSREGLRFGSPQSMLDALFDGIAFDPEAWLRKSAKEQRAELLAISEIELSIDGNRSDRAARFNSRTEVGRDVKRVQGALADLGELPAIPEARNIKEVFAEHEKAQAAQQGKANLEADAKRWSEDASRLEAQLADFQAKVDREVSARREAIRKAKAEAERFAGLAGTIEVPDLKALREEFERAREAVNVRAKHDTAKRLKEELAAAEAEQQRLTDEIAKLDGELESALRRAKFPVPGLSVGDEDVLFEGFPLSQLSQSKRLRVAMAVAMRVQERKQDRLRVVQIRNAALLDDESRQLAIDLAKANDFQLWMEVIDEEGASIVIEDGKVEATPSEAKP